MGGRGSALGASNTVWGGRESDKMSEEERLRFYANGLPYDYAVDQMSRMLKLYPGGTFGGIYLTAEEHYLLSHYEFSPQEFSHQARMIARGERLPANLDAFIKNPGTSPSSVREMKESRKVLLGLMRKIQNHRANFGTLYRVEQNVGQNYKVGQTVNLPFTSTSTSPDIFSRSGGYITTRMFHPEEPHYVLKIRGNKKVGGINLRGIATQVSQKEVLVSDKFRVVSVKKRTRVGDIGGDITEVVLERR